MSRPVAALNSQLLVRKGSARPLGLEPTERTPYDVAIAVRPSGGPAQSVVHQLPPTVPAEPETRPRDAVGRIAGVWSALASRWGLPSILFIVGLGMVTVVAATGPGAAPAVEPATRASPVSRPMGPTPVTWVDDGLMAHPGLAGR
jgi:hypothetical protein